VCVSQCLCLSLTVYLYLSVCVSHAVKLVHKDGTGVYLQVLASGATEPSGESYKETIDLTLLPGHMDEIRYHNLGFINPYKREGVIVFYKLFLRQFLLRPFGLDYLIPYLLFFAAVSAPLFS